MNWKLLFHQFFALEIKKEFVLSADSDQDAIYQRLLNAFVLYSPKPFHELIQTASAASSSEQANQEKIDFYGHPISRALIMEPAFSYCIPDTFQKNKVIKEYIQCIDEQKDRCITKSENFFASVEGQNVLQAFTFDGHNNTQEVAFVMVAGYAAHTIEHAIFEEIVCDANLFQGRLKHRPVVNTDGLALELEDANIFYGTSRTDSRFDILCPGGKELGNTTGPNQETTDRIALWLQDLPAQYKKSKFIFLGYSKGAPVVLDLAKRHPKLTERTLGYVTHAGVLQGTHIARHLIKQAEDIVREVPLGQFIEGLQQKSPQELALLLSPFFGHLDLGWLSMPKIRAVFDVLGYDIRPQEQKLQTIFQGREVQELLIGAKDMAPYERIRWNLENLNNRVFSEPTYLFNLSALTDMSDLIRPVLLEEGGAIGPSLLAPTFDTDGTIDWKNFSLDAVFLFFSSLEGFKSAAGGLYDTQVELANTKTMFLDPRPLSDSLLAPELETLWKDPSVQMTFQDNQISKIEDLAQTPRNQLIQNQNHDHIDAIDLGEFRGHHWSLFRQAFPPPKDLTEEHAEWNFPRKAYMRALLQVLALRNIVDTIGDEASKA